MIKNLLSKVHKRYFDGQLPVEQQAYMIFFLGATVVSFFAAVTHTLLGKGTWGLIFQWIYVVICLVLLFLPRRIHLAFSKGLLLFTAFIYLPVLYFQTAGYDGTTLMFAPLTTFMIAILFRGRLRMALTVLNLGIHVTCCLIQYSFPHLVAQHASAQDKLVDRVVLLTLALASLFVLSRYVIAAARQEELRTKSLLAELEEVSKRDALTGIHNRRYLSETLTRTMESGYRTERPIHFMMLDLDHFKDVNDTYGHGFGDEVLIATAAAINQSLRKSDTLARFGGEEFAVILYGAKDSVALDIAERIRQSVGSLRFRGNVAITISAGLTKLTPEDTQESFVERADQQLYRAKHEGRNRMCHVGLE